LSRKTRHKNPRNHCDLAVCAATAETGLVISGFR
jgi:hypothetical protein